MLKVHEFILPNGELSGVFLRDGEHALELVDEDRTLQLPPGALRAVMLRYGAPFDADLLSQTHGLLELRDGTTLRHVRHLAGYDVIARDYLVYTEPSLSPLCAMATHVAGALRYLGCAADKAEAAGLAKER